MAHLTNRRRVKKVQAARKNLLRALVSGDWIEAVQSCLGPLTRAEAECVATAASASPALDLWAWAQGGVQFLNPTQIQIAAKYGLQDWIEGAVSGADSADPFFTIRGGWQALRDAGYPDALAIHRRCARYAGGHSTWAYGPVYLDPVAAKAAGNTYRVNCSCGYVSQPL